MYKKLRYVSGADGKTILWILKYRVKPKNTLPIFHKKNLVNVNCEWIIRWISDGN